MIVRAAFYHQPFSRLLQEEGRQNGDFTLRRHDDVGACVALPPVLHDPHQTLNRVFTFRQAQRRVILDPGLAQLVAQFGRVQRQSLKHAVAHETVVIKRVNVNLGRQLIRGKILQEIFSVDLEDHRDLGVLLRRERSGQYVKSEVGLRNIVEDDFGIRQGPFQHTLAAEFVVAGAVEDAC